MILKVPTAESFRPVKDKYLDLSARTVQIYTTHQITKVSISGAMVLISSQTNLLVDRN
jgi:hypothetical protein